MTDPTKPLCVFEVDGKPCGKAEINWQHDTYLSSKETHHPYTPAAPVCGYWCEHCQAQVTSQHRCEALR